MLGFSSSNFTVQDHIPSTIGDALTSYVPIVVIAGTWQYKSIACFFFFLVSMTTLLPIQDVSGAAQQILVLHNTHFGSCYAQFGLRACNGKPEMLNTMFKFKKKKKKN
jgi:hypothetical protein